MAPLVSPFCSPLSSTSLERAGAPAGKQSRPIVAWSYPRWTNRRHARRAKMNGSLSLWIFLLLWPTLSAILRTLFPHLGFRHLSPAHLRVPGVLRPSDGPYVRLLPVQSSSPRCLIPCNVPTSHTVFSILLSLASLIFLSLTLSLSFFLSSSLFPSHSNAVFFISFLSYLHPTLRDFFLLSIPVKTTLFSEFLLCMHYLLPIESGSVSF